MIIKRRNFKKLHNKKLVELLSLNPSKILKLNSGTLKKRRPADIVLIDINKKIKLSSSLIKSKSNNFPYENISGQGKIMLTIVDGKIVFNDRSFNIK